MPMPTPIASPAAAPSGGASSGGSSGSSGASNNVPSGGSTGGAHTGSATPSRATGGTSSQAPKGNAPTGRETPPSNTRGQSLAERLRAAGAEESAASESASNRKLIKHKLESGDEVDVDITEHLEAELAALRKRKLKVNEKEVEVDLDEAFEKYPLAEGARQRFEEAAVLRKSEARLQAQVTKLGEQLRDPKELRNILGNPKMLGREGLLKFAEELVMEELAFEKMSPKDRANYDRQQEIEAASRKREAELNARDAKLKKSEAEASKVAAEKHRAYYAENIPKFLDGAGLPNTKETLKAFVDMKSEAIRLGIPHTNESVAREVAKDYYAGLRSVASRLPPDRLTELLGENAGKLNTAAIESVNAPGRKISVKKSSVDTSGDMPSHIKTPNQYRQWKYEQQQKAMAAKRK